VLRDGPPGRVGLPALFPFLADAITRAQGYLLNEADQGFPDTRHEMIFPRGVGFTAKSEKQASDIFVRAILANVLLDIAELEEGDQAFEGALHEIARREAELVARARLTDRLGGWSYFPDLPELPPDVDSLAAALSLFARAAPSYTPLCQEPIELVLAAARADGAVETWIISPRDDPARRWAMQRGIECYWGASLDVEVCAHFYLALLASDRQRYGPVALTGARYILTRQEADGAWPATWYWGRLYSTGLCLRLLRELGVGAEAISRAAGYLRGSQRPDGGWGAGRSVPLDTALAVSALAGADSVDEAAVIEPAVRRLVDFQARDGHWDASPWIKMDVGRADGRITHTLTYQSVTLTTAFCLRALLSARVRSERA
jgi:hypothetical protein